MRISRVGLVLLLGVGLATLAHCGSTSECLRYSDCDQGLTCAAGHCVPPAGPTGDDAGDAAASDAMTPDADAPADVAFDAVNDDADASSDGSTEASDAPTDATPDGEDAADAADASDAAVQDAADEG
jgi:hypothetical protein